MKYGAVCKEISKLVTCVHITLPFVTLGSIQFLLIIRFEVYGWVKQYMLTVYSLAMKSGCKTFIEMR